MKSPDSYHHHDLRQALLDGAVKLLKKEGIKGFSLRKLAAAEGVSHAAPYRHFANKDELLATLLLEGHRLLAARLRRARAEHPDSSRERLLAVGKAYLEFAADNPERLGLMFSREAMLAAEGLEGEIPASERESLDSFAPLEESVKECQDEGVLDSSFDSGVISIALWSEMHGLALLSNEGIIEGMSKARGGNGEATVEALFALLRRGFFGS